VGLQWGLWTLDCRRVPTVIVEIGCSQDCLLMMRVMVSMRVMAHHWRCRSRKRRHSPQFDTPQSVCTINWRGKATGSHWGHEGEFVGVWGALWSREILVRPRCVGRCLKFDPIVENFTLILSRVEFGPLHKEAVAKRRTA